MWSKDDFKELIPKNIAVIKRIFASLTSRNFRLYFIGQCISLCGSWIQNIAMSWLVYKLTGSVLLLTTVAFINQIPSLFITPFAGVFSDRFDKYKIIFSAQVIFMLQALVLTILSLSGVIELWHLIVLSFINGVMIAVEAPARQAFYAHLVPKEMLSNAIALNSVTINGTRFIGPAIGGLLVALFGEGWCFAINTVSYIAVLVALAMMTLPKFVPNKSSTKVIEQLKEGFTYINNFLPLKIVILVCAMLSFFGMPIMSVMPALVKDILGGDSIELGYLNSAMGGGALVAAFYLASRKEIKGLGKVLTINSMLMGISIIALAFTKSVWIASLISFVMGFALIGSMATCNTLLQNMVDSDKRGRVMSFFTMAFFGMIPIGGLVWGAFTKITTLNYVMLCGGVLCLFVGILYERMRPKVRAAVRNKIYEKTVATEIATALKKDYNNPF